MIEGKERGEKTRVYACMRVGREIKDDLGVEIIRRNVVVWNEAKRVPVPENGRFDPAGVPASPGACTQGATVMPHSRLPFHIPSPAKWSPFKKHYFPS